MNDEQFEEFIGVVKAGIAALDYSVRQGFWNVAQAATWPEGMQDTIYSGFKLIDETIGIAINDIQLDMKERAEP